MKIQIKAVCPYCGHVSGYQIETEQTRERKYVFYCDKESGGCDVQYVVSVELRPIVESYSIVKEHNDTESL